MVEVTECEAERKSRSVVDKMTDEGTSMHLRWTQYQEMLLGFDAIHDRSVTVGSFYIASWHGGITWHRLCGGMFVKRIVSPAISGPGSDFRFGVTLASQKIRRTCQLVIKSFGERSIFSEA